MTRASEWDGNLGEFGAQYVYQPELTKRLDGVGARPFDNSLINEIVLWKVNRYVQLGQKELTMLNSLASTRNGAHREAGPSLQALLGLRGVDLPMASTLLRFRNRSAFQIIDRHAFRALYDTRYPLNTKSPIARKIETYFKYLDDLNTLAENRRLPFETIDRILYIFDKRHNGPL